MKKTSILFAFVILLFVSSNAQTGLNFQGVARSENNVILASQTISLKLSIIQGTANGTVEYTEIRKTATNAQGLFNVVIGDANATSTVGNFSAINWSLSPKFLKIEMDPAAGDNFSVIGTTQLQSAAYAKYAESVEATNINGIVPVSKGGTGTTTGVTKTMVGLGNVDNTSDANKPVSTAQQTALDLKEALANKSTDLSADAASNTKYPSAKAVADYVSNSVSSGATPDATSTTKGKLQLSNDLGGTAAAPTVNSVGGVSSSTIGTIATTIAAATDANTVNTLVLRDGSGNFAAGMITANVTGALTGNASTATKLATARSIYGNNFDGSAALTQAIGGTYGGTGVNNGSKTITLGGNINTGGLLTTVGDFVVAGNYSTTLTATANTNVTATTWKLYYVPADSWTETGITWNKDRKSVV